MSDAGRAVPPWTFFLTAMPQGVLAGYVTVALPWLAREGGVSVERIAAASALILFPQILLFLWAPVVDLGRYRRIWLLVGAACSASALFASTLCAMPDAFDVAVALLFVGTLFNTICAASNGALMAASLPTDRRGRAAGFYQGGNVGGGAIGAGVVLWLLQTGPDWIGGIVGAALAFTPALIVLRIPEPPPGQGHPFVRLRVALVAMLRDRRTRAGIAIFLSPLGSAALMNLLSSVAVDYSAPPELVAFATGLGGGVITALGSLFGGWMSDRINRHAAYAFAGLSSAATGMLLLLLPHTATTYGAGAIAYLFTAGICYAAWNALALDVLGADGGTGATRYTLLVGLSNVPISYMTWLDGQAYGAFGLSGLLGVDAAANTAVALLVLLLLVRPALFARR